MPPFDPFNSRITYYAPGPGDRMEGPFATSQPNPITGKRVPATLDNYRMGYSPFVTLAGDPSRYGQTVNMGPLTYTSPIDRKQYTLPNVTGYVHDTGSAFQGRPDKLDVAAGDFRGWSPEKASAFVQADAGRRTVTPDAMPQRPSGMDLEFDPWTGQAPQGGAVDSPAEGPTAIASGSSPGARKMPNSLMDMFTPRDAAGDPTDIGSAIAQNRQSLIGLGMGLLTPRSLAYGANPSSAMGNALAGYAQGAQADSADNYRQAQIAHTKRQEAFQREQAAFQREQANITDAQRAMKDVLGSNATPEQKADFMKSYYSSKTDAGGWILKDIIDPNDPEGERKITVQEHNRTGQIRPPQLPGQTGIAPAPPAVNWTPGAANAPVFGDGGDFSTPSVGTAPAGQQQQPQQPQTQRHAITLPNGDVVMPPPGASKKAREAWAADVSKTVADMQTGKMTEAQGTKAIYAAGMEIAQQQLTDTSHLGISPEGKGLGGLPWGVGAYFQSNEYQNYKNAKDAWLNAKLRAESGATINPDEFARDDRIYFPQPGEGPQQIEAKKKLREAVTRNTVKAAGPAYTSPPPLAPPVTSAAPTAAPVPTGTRTGGAAVPALPAGFTIIAP